MEVQNREEEQIVIDVLTLKGEKLFSLQFGLLNTVYKLQLRIYELLGLEIETEKNDPENCWKRPRVPLVCFSQFLHSVVIC
jgi:hypothetical protein